MPAPNIAPAYLQGLAATQGQNTSADYFRVQDEIARQKAEMEAEKRRRGSFGQRMIRGVGGAIPGAAMGFLAGGPVGAGIGAGAGFAGGALDDGSGRQNVGTTIGQSIPLAAMVAGRGASYLSGGAANAAADQAVAQSGISRPLTEQEYYSLGKGGSYWNYANQF